MVTRMLTSAWLYTFQSHVITRSSWMFNYPTGGGTDSQSIIDTLCWLVSLKPFRVYSGYIHHSASISLWEFIWEFYTRCYILVHGLCFFKLLFMGPKELTSVVPPLMMSHQVQMLQHNMNVRHQHSWPKVTPLQALHGVNELKVSTLQEMWHLFTLFAWFC